MVYLVLSVPIHNFKVAYDIRYICVNDQYVPNKRIIPSAREMFVLTGYFFPNLVKYGRYLTT